MGTHISRVKSVDLDAWTDEQLQSILSWGNARANKYWEARLAAGHAPSEAKIENFIRTKYELKRWVMEGPMPDPASLDVDGDDDVPLSIVKEKQVIEKKESIRKASVGSQAPSNAPQPDLMGGDDPMPPRASTVSPAATKVPPKAEPAAPKPTSTRDSLLGLDFFGAPTAPARPSSTTGVSSSGGQSRPDLKQSILSLYASAPKPQPRPQHQHQQHGQFGGTASSPPGSGGLSHQQQQGSVGSFNDAFGSLNLSNKTGARPAAADPFAGLGGLSSSSRATPQASGTSAFGGLGGGSFFDANPSHQQKRSGSGFGGLGSFSSPPPSQPAVAPKPAPPSSAMGDLFDLSAPVSQSTSSPPPPTAGGPGPATGSVFNLSAAQSKPAMSAQAPASASSVFGGMSMGDPWGGSEWATPTPASAPAPAKASPEPAKSTTPSGMGWGGGAAFASTPVVAGSGGGFNAAPKVAADEEFGGWASSAAPSGGSAAAAPKASGFGGGDDDLFSNVWQ